MEDEAILKQTVLSALLSGLVYHALVSKCLPTCRAPTLFRRFGSAGEVAVDLLARLLSFDPVRRCNSEVRGAKRAL